MQKVWRRLWYGPVKSALAITLAGFVGLFWISFTAVFPTLFRLGFYTGLVYLVQYFLSRAFDLFDPLTFLQTFAVAVTFYTVWFFARDILSTVQKG